MLGKLALRCVELLSLGQHLPLLGISIGFLATVFRIQQNLNSTNSNYGEFLCMCVYIL
jgi:hypothetical protein